jgi:hypothetical protein
MNREAGAGENVKRERCVVCAALLRDREAMQSTITDLRNRLNHSEMLHGRYPEDAERPVDPRIAEMENNWSAPMTDTPSRPPTNSAQVSSTLVAAPQQEQAAP